MVEPCQAEPGRLQTEAEPKEVKLQACGAKMEVAWQARVELGGLRTKVDLELES